ncbi:pyridoxamine 5'-phosphate oxidase family protein [Nonomuraea sp. NPDC050790]|uniref:pyridoxamine 5'-phosphate oxidase family protein n=1 Tax=Nonomuraea sp. NPDC050790 TaxID=3364371 RepID=UPI0037962F2F
MNDDLAAMARSILDAGVYATLATADRDGTPWASPVFFAHDGYRDFYWVSSPEATHSRNLADRPELSLVVFNSQVVPGSGQAVYMRATARQVTDLEAALAIYPGAPARGGRPMAPEDLSAPRPYRLYVANVTGHHVLCPRETGVPCSPHGLSHDHRIAVTL